MIIKLTINKKSRRVSYRSIIETWYLISHHSGLPIYTLIKSIGLGEGKLTKVDFISLDEELLASSTLQQTMNEPEVFVTDEPMIVPNDTFLLQV